MRPILSALLRNKTSTFLVALQIAVTLAVVINSLFIIVQRVEKMSRDPGIDVDNIIAVYVRGFGENFNRASSIDRDLDLLRQMPGVIDATVSNHIPLSGSGSGTGLRTVPDETIESVGVGRYRMDDHWLNTLGVDLASGRNFYPEEISHISPDVDPPAPPSVLITQEMADELFPDGNALGQMVYWGSMESSTVIGIIHQMHGSWVGWDGLGRVVIQPGKDNHTTNKYMIRTEPGRRDELIPQIEKQLGELDRQRVVKKVRSMEEMAARSYRRDRGMAIILATVIGLLIGITLLVIVGLASFHVSQRTRQIGTRRALGARKADIVRQFLIENWLVSTGGALLGGIMTVGLAMWLETSFSLARLDWRYLPVGIVILWIVGTLAAWAPARRAAAVPPAVATRSV
jgi:putative ABC transport system permease protein